MKATKWDGVGPKRECLLLVTWNSDGDGDWIHFDWDTGDEDFGTGYVSRVDDLSLCEDEEPYSPTRGELIPSDSFEVTHWAELPELPAEKPAKRDIHEVLDQLAAVVPAHDAFSERLEWLKNHLFYQAPEIVWHEATPIVSQHLERWRSEKAAWFKEAFAVWMNRPWQEGDPQ